MGTDNFETENKLTKKPQTENGQTSAGFVLRREGLPGGGEPSSAYKERMFRKLMHKVEKSGELPFEFELVSIEVTQPVRIPPDVPCSNRRGKGGRERRREESGTRRKTGTAASASSRSGWKGMRAGRGIKDLNPALGSILHPKPTAPGAVSMPSLSRACGSVPFVHLSHLRRNPNSPPRLSLRLILFPFCLSSSSLR